MLALGAIAVLVWLVGAIASPPLLPPLAFGLFVYIVVDIGREERKRRHGP